jgi:hypothetical protein
VELDAARPQRFGERPTFVGRVKPPRDDRRLDPGSRAQGFAGEVDPFGDENAFGTPLRGVPAEGAESPGDGMGS